MKNNKLNNKGFSLVELIIVIAIMAILAAALAPQLIKYIEKSRISSDKTAAASVKSAFDTAISNEDAYDEAVAGDNSITCTTASDLALASGTGTNLLAEMGSTLTDLKAPKSKIGKNSGAGKYCVSWEVDNNKIVNIKYGTGVTAADLGDDTKDVMSVK